MRIYLASRYSRIGELQQYRRDLVDAGHVVTSRWLNGSHQAADYNMHHVLTVKFAKEDYDDILNADCVISFTEAPRTGLTRGGRHVEFGAALALGRKVVVVGHRENVFHALPQVEFFETWSEALEHLCG